LVVRLGFALVVPALILVWSLFTLAAGQSSTASGISHAPGGALSGDLYQAGQDGAAPTPTIEVYDPNTATASTPTPISEDQRAEIFDGVWSTVNENYIDPKFNGVDWARARDEYRQRALNATTGTDFYGALVDMVALLHDQRATFTPPGSVPMPTAGTDATGYANIGVTRAFDNNSLLVLYVYPGSPADKADLKRRDRITAIDGKPVTEEDRKGSALAGIVGSKVTVTVRSPGGQTRDVTLTREIVVGRAPALSRQLAEDPTVAYYGIPTLSVANIDFMTVYLLGKMHRQFLVQDMPLKGVVLDLRQTSGNSPEAMSVVLGEFTNGTLGSFESRNQANNSDLEVPSGPLFDKFARMPLVLLVDGGTQGDAEVMAAALQAQGRAKIVGTRTAGNTVSTATYTWTNGRDQSALTTPQWRFLLPDGTNIDGRGLTPDVEVSDDWTQHPEDSDPYIDAAVSLLHSMRKP
jgi:C-terminal peptidase prc